jgi:hypothetical protein
MFRIRDPVLFGPLNPGWKKSGSGSGMNTLDNFSERLDTVLGLKIHKSFDANPDPETWNRDQEWKNSGPGSGINITNPQHHFRVLVLYHL